MKRCSAKYSDLQPPKCSCRKPARYGSHPDPGCERCFGTGYVPDQVFSGKCNSFAEEIKELTRECESRRRSIENLQSRIKEISESRLMGQVRELSGQLVRERFKMPTSRMSDEFLREYSALSIAAGGTPSIVPVPLLLWCPECGERHVDGLSIEGIDWSKKPHTTHACQHCGHIWRPALVSTVGVRFLPGFKNDVPTQEKKP